MHCVLFDVHSRQYCFVDHLVLIKLHQLANFHQIYCSMLVSFSLAETKRETGEVELVLGRYPVAFKSQLDLSPSCTLRAKEQFHVLKHAIILFGEISVREAFFFQSSMRTCLDVSILSEYPASRSLTNA